jgi:hypothetical protein
LQAKVRGRYFVQLDAKYRKYFSDLADWSGRPLRLKHGIYGQKFSGKYWNLDFSQWLLSKGFVQSTATADATYFVRHNGDRTWIRELFSM